MLITNLQQVISVQTSAILVFAIWTRLRAKLGLRVF
jgi:hypothetical protein